MIGQRFDRNRPFFHIIMSYVSQLVGCKELAVRGIFGSQSMNDVLGPLITVGAPTASWSKDKLESLNLELNLLLGPRLQLRSEFLGDSIPIDIDDVALETTSEFGYVAAQITKAAGTVFILAHECSRGKPWHNREPLWEFLRHCSNVARDGGVFKFQNDEPDREARWGQFEITESLQGTALFKGPDGAGMLSLGDPIPLLWEIEQAYPAT